MHQLDFSVSREDLDLITKIAERADTELFTPQGVSQTPMTTMMDLTIVHNQCPLDLSGLLTAGLGDFGHDIGGIRRHLDRETGQLGGCFLPRFAKH